MALTVYQVWYNKNSVLHEQWAITDEMHINPETLHLTLQLLTPFKPFADDIQYSIWSDPKNVRYTIDNVYKEF